MSRNGLADCQACSYPITFTGLPNDQSAVSASNLSAERWLQPGTEYALSKKLLLPKHWYQEIHLNTDGMDSLEGQLRALFYLAPYSHGEPHKHRKQRKAHVYCNDHHQCRLRGTFDLSVTVGSCELKQSLHQVQCISMPL